MFWQWISHRVQLFWQWGNATLDLLTGGRWSFLGKCLVWDVSISLLQIIYPLSIFLLQISINPLSILCCRYSFSFCSDIHFFFFFFSDILFFLSDIPFFFFQIFLFFFQIFFFFFQITVICLFFSDNRNLPSFLFWLFRNLQ